MPLSVEARVQKACFKQMQRPYRARAVLPLQLCEPQLLVMLPLHLLYQLRICNALPPERLLLLCVHPS